jgi:subtilisin-like proprotein convertase family protein
MISASRIVLVSPGGTESVLATVHDDRHRDYDWTFSSVRHWGESSIGDWQLIVSDTTTRTSSYLLSAPPPAPSRLARSAARGVDC